MTRQSQCVRVVVELWLLVGVMSVAGAAAQEIKLKDGTTISAKVLGKDQDSVALQLSRADVVSIDGQPLPPPVKVGSTAPVFEAIDLKGATYSLAASRGSTTLLQFWATWCPHCRSDLSTIKELFGRYHDQGLRVVTVSIDQDLGTLRRFVQEHNLPYPVIAAQDRSPTAGNQPSLPDLYEMRGVPAYYLIDAKGVIAQIFSGSVTETKIDLEGALKRLLPPAKPSSAS